MIHSSEARRATRRVQLSTEGKPKEEKLISEKLISEKLISE